MPSSRAVFDRYVDNNAHRLDAPAFTFILGGKQKSWSYRELFSEAERLGKQQRLVWDEIGGKAEGLLAILTASQEQQTLQVLGALSAGLIPTVLTPPNPRLNPEYYVATTIGVLDKVAPALLITELSNDVFADANNPYAVVSLEHELIRRGSGSGFKVPESSAFVQFSSGTTGIKKGVAVSADALFAQLDAYASALELTNDDCVVSWLPLYHDMGYITALHMALFAGVHTVMLDPVEWVSNPAIYLQAVGEFGATLSWHPNFAFAFMAARVTADKHSSLKTLRHVVNCSEPVTSAAQAAFIERFKPNGFNPEAVTGCYAMAETTFAVTHSVDTNNKALDETGPDNLGTLNSRLPIPSVGTPLAGVTIEVRSDGQVLPDRSIGEIWIKAPFLALGYLGAESPEGSSFVDGWYQSGDLGYFVDGSLYVTGRKKDLIIVAGHNVFPDDIERTIGEGDGVKAGRVAVFAEFDDRVQTERVVAVAETDGELKVDVVQLRQRLLVEYSVAVNIHVAEPGWLIKSSSGKISRAKSREKWLAQ